MEVLAVFGDVPPLLQDDGYLIPVHPLNASLELSAQNPIFRGRTSYLSQDIDPPPQTIDQIALIDARPFKELPEGTPLLQL